MLWLCVPKAASLVKVRIFESENISKDHQHHGPKYVWPSKNGFSSPMDHYGP